ncbi:MAG TPA: phosphate acyltransferase, partial [bacterium]|nr:phosphate acyltransferase [bacterium]
LTGEEPMVAMLSFSTKGSAKHEAVDKVVQAHSIVREKRPDIKIDGELQFDAAFIESIGQRKAPGSAVAGKANVFIFPNLDAGNICYKVTERIGKAQAIGPVIQGLAKPINDLSRGCTPEDIANVTAICALKA